MAKVTFKGINQYIAQLQRIYNTSEDQMKRALYVGAGIVANGIKSSMAGLPTSDPNMYYKKGVKEPGLTPEQKAELIAGFGLAHMRTENGNINTKAGFTGTSSSGVTVATLARRAESGTSWMNKTPFIRAAVSSTKGAAEAAMKAAFDKEISKYV